MKINKLFSKIFFIPTSAIAISVVTFFATSCSNAPSAPQTKYAFGENVFCNVEPTDPIKAVNRSKLELFNIFDKQAPRASGEPMTFNEIKATLNTIIYMDLALALSDSADVKAFSITDCKTTIAPNKLEVNILINPIDKDISKTAIIYYDENKDDATKVYFNIELIDDPTNPVTIPSYIYRNTTINP